MSRKNISKFSLGYEIFHWVASFYHHLYYRKFTVKFRNKIPVNKPVIFAANHQNALMDALAIIFSSNFFEVQKYLSLTNHVWSSATLVTAKGVWDKVSAADQQAIQKVAFTWRDKQRKMVQESSDDFLAKLKAKGMQVSTPNNALFVQAVAPVWKQYEDVFGKEFFDLIEKARK